jgi:hypothetical protein
MSDATYIAQLEAELMELRSRPRGIGDGDIQRIINQRDDLRAALIELENVAGCMYPMILILCDDEVSRPKMKTARMIVDLVRGSGVITRAKILARDTK